MLSRCLLGCALLSQFTACVSDPVEPELPVETPKGVSPAWHYLGPVELSQDSAGGAWDPEIVEGPPRLATPQDAVLAQHDGGSPGRFGVMYVDFEQRAEYIASYDAAAVTAAAAELGKLGYGAASEGSDSLARPRGLSNDLDNRISFQSYADTHSTLRRIGRVGGGCSGALFGNRLVLTAAHCIFDGAGNYRANNTFSPRRNGSSFPFGTVASQGALYPISYRNDGCNTAYTAACVKNDWAILVLPPNPWANSPNGSPGYLGVWWAGDSTLAGFAVRNIGYPMCNDTMSPSGCVSHVAYGDLECAGVAPAFSDPDSRWPLHGTNGKIRNGCDTSAGHSGGPIYSSDPGSNGPYIIGNTVWNQCNSSTCGPLTQYSSAGVRIPEALAEYMMNLRASYP